MLFVDNDIRKMCLSKKKSNAELAIAELTKALVEKKRMQTLLLFDLTKQEY